MAGRTKGMMSLLIQSCVIHALFKPTICSRSYSLPFFFCLAVFLPSRARHGPHVTAVLRAGCHHGYVCCEHCPGKEMSRRGQNVV